MTYPPLPEPHGKTFDEEGRPVNGGHYYPLEMHAYIAPVLAERDALREQVRMLREALDDIATETYDSWTNGAKAGKIARAALAATKEQIE